MKQAFFVFLLIFFGYSSALAIDVELITRVKEITQAFAEPELGSPSGMIVDEVGQIVTIKDEIKRRELIVPFPFLPESKVNIVNLSFPVTGSVYQFGKNIFCSYNSWLRVIEGKRDVLFINDSNVIQSGICFIEKKDSKYFAFFTNETGTIGAVDSTGKLYDSQEAFDVLKVIDPEKFERSRLRAQELGLESWFLSGGALVWGETYYNTPKNLKTFWNKTIIYPRTEAQIQYDLHGYGYMASFNFKGYESSIWIVDRNANLLQKIFVSEYSQILPIYERGRIYTTATYVGFGGNVYFYVAGKEFTELFRIRRTWGEPDFYAMAVNGYTEDGYGKYVKQTLAKLSKEELRLLRNHLFALYGYVFQSKDLAGYFEKQVWYLSKAEATTIGIESALPAERRALLDLVKAEESKR